MQRFQPSGALRIPGGLAAPRRRSYVAAGELRTRVYVIVAAVRRRRRLTVGVTLATRTPTPKRPPVRPARRRSSSIWACAPTRRRSRCGGPTTLQRAASAGGRPIFGRYGSLEAQVGAALAAWPAGFGSLAALAQRTRKARSRSSTTGSAPLARRYAGREGGLARRRRASPTRRTPLRAQDLLYPRLPAGPPPFVPSFPLRRPSTGCRRRAARVSEALATRRRRAEAALRRGAPAPRPTAIGPARVRRGGGARPGRRRAAGRRCGRALRQGRSVSRLLPAGAAGAALSEEPERALPPRPLPALARKREAGSPRSSGSPGTRAGYPLGGEARRFLAQLSRIKPR